jgi:hypothetical protein
MDISKDFIKAKRPCADGYRWYVRHGQDHGYQDILDALVDDGRVDDALWLLDKFGPTDTVLTVQTLGAHALVFAGEVRVLGIVDVTTTLRTGRGLRAAGGIRVGADIVTGDDLTCGAAIFCGGQIRTGGALSCEWSIAARDVRCGGRLRCGWSLQAHGELDVAGEVIVGGDIQAEGPLSCRKGVKAHGCVEVGGTLAVTHGVSCGGSLRCEGSVDVGWGICAAGDVSAAGAVRVGESIAAEGHIRCGEGYGIYAGLHVREDAWEASARVAAAARPPALRSGWWSGPGRGDHRAA